MTNEVIVEIKLDVDYSSFGALSAYANPAIIESRPGWTASPAQ